MLEILTKICDGKGTPEDITKLEKLGKDIMRGSVCGLGQTAPNPVLSTLRYFRDEYNEHVGEKVCRAKECR
jgi:NADH:ubiquinone oxidoreductase subunit F (NADH-binding)